MSLHLSFDDPCENREIEPVEHPSREVVPHLGGDSDEQDDGRGMDTGKTTRCPDRGLPPRSGELQILPDVEHAVPQLQPEAGRFSGRGPSGSYL